MITGKIKFLEEDFATIANSATAVTDDGTNAELLLSENVETQWVSLIDSDDVAVTITINFPATRIDRILLVNHNIREMDIIGSIANVKDGDNRDISTTGIINSRTTSYFSFSEVLLTSLTFVLRGTITPNQLKRIGRIILTKEIGTLEGYPIMSGFLFSDNAASYKAKAGRELISKQLRTLSRFRLSFKNYTKINDIALMHRIHRRQTPLLIWPCGGKEDNFRFLQEGIRLQDIYRMQSKGNMRSKLKAGNYTGLLDVQITFVEAV